MGRRRQSNFALPPKMHLKSGCYYYVTSGKPRKWIRLHEDLAKARVLWAQLEGGGGTVSNLFTVHLDEYLASEKFAKLAKATRRQYENVAIRLREVFKGATLGVITPSHVALWLDKHPSAIQANTGKAIMSNVFDIAVRYGVVDRNPCREISYLRVKSRDRVVTPAEYESMRNAAPDFVQIAMDIAALTGTRIQDILDIKLQDCSESGLFISQGKTKKRMFFEFSPALAAVIARARALPRPIRGLHLLCTRRGQPYRYGTFNWHWLKVVRSVGVEGVHFNDLRAKAAMDAKAMGYDAQKLLGHSSPAMTDIYLRDKEIARVQALPGKA